MEPNEKVKRLEDLVGQPSSEQTKSLFEIVENLNREILELKFEIRNHKKPE